MRKTFLGLLFVILVGGIFSCKKDRSPDTDPQAVEDVTVSVKTDVVTEDFMNSVEHLFNPNVSRSASSNHSLPSCVTITRIQHGDTLLVTWEFDSSGCQMPNGRTYTGTLHIERIRDRSNGTYILHVETDSLTVDGVLIEGEFTRLRTRTNSNGNPESTVTFDFHVIWPNGDAVTRQGTRMREWIEGYNTPRRGDDVWLITGNWHAVHRNGTQLDARVITPLRREFACRYIVSGVLQVERNGETYSIDFGNGTCDDEAVLTLPNGQTRTIYLR